MRCKIKFSVLDDANNPLTEDKQTFVEFDPEAPPPETKEKFIAAGMIIGQFALYAMVPDYQERLRTHLRAQIGAEAPTV